MAVPVGMPDHALLTRARDGDGEAFEALYRRHHRAATRAAHSYSSRTQLAEDAVQEAFMRILHATQEGGGPKTEFRAYLATTVRHVIAGWTRGERTILTDELDELAGEDTRDSHRPESRLRWHLLTKAFKSLPTRWQEALWLGEVEGVAPAELAERWNMSANSAAALSYRAREGLRTAWLDAHVNEGLVPDECRPFVADLSRYTQGKLTDRRELQVRSHLEDCEYCRGVLFEVDTAASELRVLLIPVAAWGGLAIAGAGVAGGTLAGLAKLGGGLGTRGLALGAASTAAVTAIVVVTVAMNPGIADAFGTDPAGARPLVTLGPAGGNDPDDGSDDDAENDGAEEPTAEPTPEPTDGPSDDPTAVPTPDADDDAPGSNTNDDDAAPTGTGPTQSTDPTTPPTTPPVAPPTDEPEEPAVPAAPGIRYEVVDGVIVLSGEGEPGATVSLQATATVGGGGGGTGATGRAVVPRAPAGVLANVAVDSAGKWTLTPDLDAVVGLRISAIQTTHDGRVSTAATVDLPSRPAALEVTFADERVGQWIGISGQVEMGAEVELDTTDAAGIAGLAIESDGSWTARVDLLSSGGSDLVARQWFDGLPSLTSTHRLPEFVLNDLTLAVPSLTGDDIVFSGTGEPGASVMVTGEGIETGTTVSASGAWTATFPSDPTLGGVSVVATQTLSDRMSKSEAVAVPEIPLAALTLAADRVGGNIVISGIGQPGATVVVTGEAIETEATTVGEDGGWSTSILASSALSGRAVVATQTLGDQMSTSEPTNLPSIAAVPAPAVILTVLADSSLTVTGTTSQSGRIDVRLVGEDTEALSGTTIWAANAWIFTSRDPRIRTDSQFEAVLVVDGVESLPILLNPARAE